MKISLISVGAKAGRGKHGTEELSAMDYMARASRFAPAECGWVETAAAFWERVDASQGRAAAKVLLMDSSGRTLTSPEFAESIRDFRDRGTQQLVVGIGGSDGWTSACRLRADLIVSMGRMTLPHALARVVAAEQIYRAMTILAGHPYHCGH